MTLEEIKQRETDLKAFLRDYKELRDYAHYNGIEITNIMGTLDNERIYMDYISNIVNILDYKILKIKYLLKDLEIIESKTLADMVQSANRPEE